MSRSAIYVVNQGAQTVAADGIIALGNTVRRFGCNLSLQGNAVQTTGEGYYDVSASITLAPTAIGVVTVTLLKDGVAIPGAIASAQATAANQVLNLNIEALIRECCCGCYTPQSNLSLQLSTTAASVTNVATKVIKL